MIHRLPILLTCLLAFLTTAVPVSALVQPGTLNSAAELTFMAAQINASAQPWLANYNAIPSYASYTPQTGPIIEVPSPATETNAYFKEDCRAAYGSALQWVVTGVTARATKSIQILDYLAATVVNATGTNVRLDVSWRVADCIAAAEIMRDIRGGWSGATAFAAWVNSFIVPRLQSTDPAYTVPTGTGNWAIFGARSRMAIGVFLNNQTMYNQGLADMRIHINEGFGRYFPAGVGAGFYRETCRQGNNSLTLAGGDLAHTQMAFVGLVEGAEIAKHQGDDLYEYLGPGDNVGIEIALNYHDQWVGYPGRAGSTQTGWPCATSLSTIDTSAWSNWRVAYNHYRNASYEPVAQWTEPGSCTNNDSCLPSVTHLYNESGGPVADTTDPTTPGSPAANANSSSQITVSWTASTDAVGVTGYRLDECSTAACTPSVQLVVVGGTTLSYAHTGLAASSLHRYRIRALDAAGNDSAQTATVEATTQAATPTPELGDIFWVSEPDGNNANPGSEAQPFRTIAFALAQMGPGDTLYARGTHDPGAVAVTPVSGSSWALPVTVRNWPGTTFTLTHPASSGCYLNINSPTKYFQMIGEAVAFGATKRIILDRCAVGSSISTPGNEMGGAGEYVLDHVEVRNNSGTTASIGRIFRNVRLSNIKCHHNGTGGLDHCVYTHPDNVILEGFECYENSGFCFQLQNTREQQGETCPPPNGCGINNLTIRNNVIRNNTGGGIIVRGNTGAGASQIYNNFIYGNGGSSGLLLSNGPSALMANNTIYGNNVGLSTITAQNCQVRLYGNPQVINNLAVSSATNRPDFCHDNTIVTAGSPPSFFFNNLFGAGINALFTNPAAGDFRLLAGSQAINAGLALAGVPHDFFGASRPAGPSYDVGAHEFGGVITPPAGDSTPPSTPTLLQLTLISPTRVDLDWTDSTDGVGVTGYRVLRCSHTGAGCVPSAIIATPVASAYSDTSAVGATMYVYAVVAFDAAGNLSQASATAGITTTTPPADITAPSVPTSPLATAIAFDQVSLTWTASTDAVGVTGYLIRRCTGGACTPSVQVDVSSVASYSSLGLSASTTYGYSVAARDASNNVSAYSSTAYATTPAAGITPSIILLLNNSSANTGTNGATPVATSITFTTNAVQLAEGTHAGVWNASSDVITVPLTGFTTPTNMTLAASFYADTAFSLTRNVLGHTTIPTYANRMQIYTNATGRLGIGLGNSHTTNTDVLGANLSLSTLYRVVLRVYPTGAYHVTLMADGSGVIATATGTYTGLTTLAPNLIIGNNGGNQNEGWRGSIDAVIVENRVWSDAEVSADCVLYVDSCTPPAPPTFDPFVMTSGVQGDGTLSANNTTVTVTMTGTPDPVACADLTQFYLAYGGTREPVTSCSLNGSILQLSMATPPASPTITLGLTYLPTAQQMFLTNSTVADLTTGDDLQQISWWCRRDVSDATHWENLPNQMCRVPSPGVINLRVDVVNVSGGDSLAQAYALYCDTNLNDGTDAVRISEDQTEPFDCTDTPLGLCLNRVSRGVADGTVRPPVLPNPSGVTAVEAGRLQRSDVALISPVLAPNTRTEFEFSLRVAPGVARGTIFYCGVRPASSGAPLSLVNLAPIRVDTARFFSE